MMLKGAFVLVLMLSTVSALGIDLNCPDSVHVDTEFECVAKVVDGDGVIYDLKINTEQGQDTSLYIFDKEKGWIKGWYYLKNFIEKEEVVGLKILDAGDYNIVAKLRYDGKTKTFDGGKISVGAGAKGDVNNEEDAAESRYVKEVVFDTQSSAPKDDGDEVIFLGGAGESAKDGKEEWGYVSKEGKVVDWLPYAFCLFLIILVGVLVWDKAA